MTFALPGIARLLRLQRRYASDPFIIRRSSRFSITRCGKRCTFSSSIASSATMSATAGFLYPFLGQQKQETGGVVDDEWPRPSA
jgi:hypothetical protein